MSAPGGLRSVSIASPRLQLHSFAPDDAPEAFAPVTPTLTRFLAWDPSPSLEAFAEIWRTWLSAMAASSSAARRQCGRSRRHRGR